MEPKQLVGFFVGLIIMATVGMSVLTGPVMQAGGQQAHDTVEVTGGEATVETGVLQNVRELSATTSLEDAAHFDGDGSVSGDIADVSVTGNFSACTYASASSAAVSNNRVQTALAIDSLTLYYNGSSDAYEAAFYNRSSRTTTVANVSVSGTEAQQLRPVCAVHADGGLTVHTNGTSGTGVGTATGGDTWPSTQAWNGTIEETRVYHQALNASQRGDYFASPTLAVTGQAPAARLTFDTRASGFGGSVPIHFASGEADVTNATRVVGFAGPGISAGSDYSRDVNTISILSGGQLDSNGEVLFTTFRTGTQGADLVGLFIGLFLLGAVYVGIQRVMP